MICRESPLWCKSSINQALAVAALAGLLGITACEDVEAYPTIPGVAFGNGVTSSVVDPNMTLDKFKTMCTEKGGRLEIHPHCGGANSCKGFSYDLTTHVFTEHSCKGLNTCTGYSCVLS